MNLAASLATAIELAKQEVKSVEDKHVCGGGRDAMAAGVPREEQDTPTPGGQGGGGCAEGEKRLKTEWKFSWKWDEVGEKGEVGGAGGGGAGVGGNRARHAVEGGCGGGSVSGGTRALCASGCERGLGLGGGTEGCEPGPEPSSVDRSQIYTQKHEGRVHVNPPAPTTPAPTTPAPTTPAPTTAALQRGSATGADSLSLSLSLSLSHTHTHTHTHQVLPDSEVEQRTAAQIFWGGGRSHLWIPHVTKYTRALTFQTGGAAHGSEPDMPGVKGRGGEGEGEGGVGRGGGAGGGGKQRADADLARVVGEEGVGRGGGGDEDKGRGEGIRGNLLSAAEALLLLRDAPMSLTASTGKISYTHTHTHHTQPLQSPWTAPSC
jgi:hypothetical protein